MIRAATTETHVKPGSHNMALQVLRLPMNARAARHSFRLGGVSHAASGCCCGMSVRCHSIKGRFTRLLSQYNSPEVSNMVS